MSDMSFNARGDSSSMISQNATLVSLQHKHAPHLRHIDPRTDIYGPPINAFLKLRLYQPVRTSTIFLLDILQKIEIRTKGFQLAPVNRFFYTMLT